MQEKYQKSFQQHKAHIVENNENFLVIDWRKENGSSDYYVRYYIDLQQGKLIVTGDLGSSIACWYSRVTPRDLKHYLNSPEYYMEKMLCSTNKYEYRSEDIRSDLNRLFDDIRMRNPDSDQEELEEDLEQIRDWYDEYCTIQGVGVFPSEITDVFEKYDEEWWTSFGRVGERIATRVYLWITGYQMACEQLGI